MYQNKIRLADLVNLGDWQKIQDSFSEVLGITIRTLNPKGRLLTKISGPSLLLNKLIQNRDIPAYAKLCGSCILRTPVENIRNKIDIKDITDFKCPFGLSVFAIPIKAFGNRTVAFMTIGPVILNKRKEIYDYKRDAEKAGIDPEELIDGLVELNVFSYSRIRSVTLLLSDIFSYMAQTGYHKKRLGEIKPELIKIDPMFSRYYEEKVLNALLNVCTLAFHADSGSVMTLNRDTSMLHIKVASKLNEEIANNADIRLGEGIAGLAAANAEPIILPKDRDKNGLAQKMKRKYIKSSMIVPFSKADNHDVYGVINLNIMRKEKDFSEDDIAFVKELLKLASLALIPVK